MRRSSLAVALLACLGPTEITVEITTDVACSSVTNTAITVGTVGTGSEGIESLDPSAVTDTCQNGRIGSIVIVPGRRPNDLVGIRVASGIGRDAATCKPPYGPGCIVSRSAIKFVSHENLHLNVVMHGICNGNACDPDSTCNEQGICVPLVPNGNPPPPPAIECPLVGVDSTAAYPTFGYCPAHRNRTRFTGPRTFTFSSTYGASANPQNPPVVAADGTMYFENATSHRISGYRMGGGGTLKWTTANPVGTIAHITPLIGAGGIVYAASTNTLVALDPATGQEKWNKNTGPVSGLALGAMEDGRLVFGTTLRTVEAYTTSGAQSFVEPVPDEAIGSVPTQGANGLLWVRAAHWMVGLNAKGNTAHAHQIPGIGNSVIAMPDGTLRTQDPAASLVHVHSSTGFVTKSLQIGAANAPMAVADDGTLYLSYSNDDKLHAIAPDGSERWAVPGKHGAPLVDATGVVYVCNVTAKSVEAIDPKNGAILHSALVGEPCTPSPVLTAQGVLIVVGAGGTFHSTN